GVVTGAPLGRVTSKPLGLAWRASLLSLRGVTWPARNSVGGLGLGAACQSRAFWRMSSPGGAGGKGGCAWAGESRREVERANATGRQPEHGNNAITISPKRCAQAEITSGERCLRKMAELSTKFESTSAQNVASRARVSPCRPARLVGFAAQGVTA